MPSCPGVFQIGIFWVMVWVNRGVFSPKGYIPVLLIFFPYYVSIRRFCYDLYVPIFSP